MSIILYSLLLYYLDQRHQGINIFTMFFRKSRLLEVSKNEDIIIDEDSDVSDERAKVRTKYLNVKLELNQHNEIKLI